jgi:glycosyltransferase involved in cell wall biosynthesis
MKKIIIVTDTYEQTNGVCTTLTNIIDKIDPDQYYVNIFSPKNFKIIKTIHGVDLCLPDKDFVLEDLGSEPFAIHLLTEGPTALSARSTCLSYNLKYTSSLLTFWDSFFWKNFYLPKPVSNLYLKWFHKHSEKLMVSNTGMLNLARKYNKNTVIWSKGISENFYPRNNKEKFRALFVGRVSKEKNIEAFLKLDIPHKKIVVGNGPDLQRLKNKYKNVEFKGCLYGSELAEEYSKASIFVFPSKFDTFGLVMIEAIACGTPVAAYPVNGPAFILKSNKVGVTSKDLKYAIKESEKKFDREYANMFCKGYTWENSAKQFVNNLVWNNL